MKMKKKFTNGPANISKHMKADGNTPFAHVTQGVYVMQHETYTQVKIFVDIHASDHVGVAFEITNDFQGIPIDLVEREVRNIRIGTLNQIALIDNMSGDKTLNFSVSLDCLNMDGLSDEMTKYLDELARRCATQSGESQKLN